MLGRECSPHSEIQSNSWISSPPVPLRRAAGEFNFSSHVQTRNCLAKAKSFRNPAMNFRQTNIHYHKLQSIKTLSENIPDLKIAFCCLSNLNRL